LFLSRPFAVPLFVLQGKICLVPVHPREIRQQLALAVGAWRVLIMILFYQAFLQV
jgi:hypothetical protein